MPLRPTAPTPCCSLGVVMGLSLHWYFTFALLFKVVVSNTNSTGSAEDSHRFKSFKGLNTRVLDLAVAVVIAVCVVICGRLLCKCVKRRSGAMREDIERADSFHESPLRTYEKEPKEMDIATKVPVTAPPPCIDTTSNEFARNSHPISKLDASKPKSLGQAENRNASETRRVVGSIINVGSSESAQINKANVVSEPTLNATDSAPLMARPSSVQFLAENFENELEQTNISSNPPVETETAYQRECVDDPSPSEGNTLASALAAAELDTKKPPVKRQKSMPRMDSTRLSFLVAEDLLEDALDVNCPSTEVEAERAQNDKTSILI